jgi:hypothetical protein
MCWWRSYWRWCASPQPSQKEWCQSRLEHVKKSTFGRCRTHAMKSFAIRSSLSDL